MNEETITVSNLYKRFKVYDDIFLDRLKEKVFFWKGKDYYRYFTALDNVNLEVKSGEVLGIIGPNGAGKTTLLKILARISYPTSGEVSVNGSLVAVLSLGLGFNPRFTGRENIFIGGSLLGMSLEEIREKEEWIVDFSELRQFIDQPIRTYSTGMWARLSFSVAAAVSPDILIIDEALATGDAFFVQKSLGRIHEICKSGTTALFVSHNIHQIQRLCSERVLLMEKGKVVNDDKAHNVIGQYNDLIFKYREKEALKNRPSYIETTLKNKDFTGNGDIIIKRVFVTDNNNNETVSVKTGEDVYLHLEYAAKKDKKDVNVIIVMENYSGICAYGFKSDNYFDSSEKKLANKLLDFKKGKGELIIGFNPMLLTTNKYLLSVTLYDADQLVDKDSDYYSETIFRKRHMAELSVFKPMDLNTSLIFEHPVSVKVLQK
jgi:ABC-type polysaccharide/polyol phosphate transport system ATPase subunit